ncbi:MAG: carbohydrate binding family 9 domain-containing protein, partial [Saprospiraceae bacterium]|nr:carbohydrate binding family 9 domain-containing protein [Saprospiraceae bacterium]
MTTTKTSVLLLLCACFFSTFVKAQGPNALTHQLHIKKATQPIKVDGRLDESDWQGDQTAEKFKLMFPNDTAFSKWPTVVRATFDDQFIYFGAVCYQKRSDYTVQSLRRDFGPGTTDVINVLLSPAKDGLNGFLFGVSPFNVQREGLVDNGANMAFEWDNKWYSAVQNYDDHWVVEMAIPFKTLRYTVSSGENSWDLQFIRAKVKDFEASLWGPVPFQYSSTSLSFAGRLIWDTPPPKPGANISLIPYSIGTTAVNYNRSEPDLERSGTTADFSGNIGADAKIGITSGLNLDLTINPDFSQVEVDRQVTNLSRFELFFPETRQFFLENRDLFAMFGFPNTRPFFSRRIGLAYNPVKGQNEKVPILAGARLSGKLTDGLRVGLLNMQTRKQTWSDDDALPGANFTVATVQQKVFSRSAISAIFTNKQNDLAKLNETQKADWQPWNRVAGLEYNLYSKDNRWEGEWYYHRSFSPDPKRRG